MNILTVQQTIINIGSIEVDGYSADEKCDRGEYINYLSGQGLAVSIGLTDKTTRPNSLPQGLKAMLGEDFTTRPGRYVMSSGGVSKINLWRIPDANKFYLYHFGQGNQLAGQILIALASTTLDLIINDALGRGTKTGDAQRIASNRILDQPDPWKLMYTREFCDIVVKWFGVGFFWDFCYYFMTAEERSKLNLLNPVVNGDRDKRIHQYLEPQTKERLTVHVVKLSTLILSATSKQNFLDSYAKVFNRQWQQDLDLKV